MAKNDYFVMAYKLLRYLYSCLRRGQIPNLNYITHDSKFFPVGKAYFDYLIEHLSEAGYIDNVIVQYMDDTVVVSFNESIRITPEGIEYLEDNRKMKKIRRIAKDIRELIP